MDSRHCHVDCHPSHSRGILCRPSAVYPGREALEEGINFAVKCGWDTETVSAIAGSLLSAIHGCSAIPGRWIESLRSWIDHFGVKAPALLTLVQDSAAGDQPESVLIWRI